MAIAELNTSNKIKHDPEEIYEWIHEQSRRLDIDIVLYTQEASMEGPYLYIPAYLPGGKDAYDYAVKLRKFENSWNDQEPRPNPPINLIPERSPEQQAVWERLWKARERKTESADAVAAAVGEEEQQKSLSELRAARAAEVQAEADYENLYLPKSPASSKSAS